MSKRPLVTPDEKRKYIMKLIVVTILFSTTLVGIYTIAKVIFN